MNAPESDPPPPGRLRGLAALLDATAKVLWPVVWLVVLGVVLGALGHRFGFGSKRDAEAPARDVVVAPPIDWRGVDADIVAAFRTAASSSEAYAEREIDQWIGEMVARMDEEFLDWYFGYWNQQKIGLSGLWSATRHWFSEDSPTAAEAMTAEIQREFSARVLRPEISQRRLETIADEMVQVYLRNLSADLRGVRAKFRVPEATWDRYLGEISATVYDVEANRQVPLTLKAVAVPVIAVGAVATRNLTALARVQLQRFGGTVSTRVGGRAAAGMATRTGSRVAAGTGGKMLGWVIAVGVIVWDVYDHKSTTATERPLMRRNLLDYFELLKTSLLADSETGLMRVVADLEQQYVAALERKPPTTPPSNLSASSGVAPR